MKRAQHLILIAAAVMGLLALGALMDGPSDMEVERMTAADLQDAVTQARHDAPQVRIEVARLEAEDYPRIVPLTPEQMQRVAMLDRK
jgi:hypothetical protein